VADATNTSVQQPVSGAPAPETKAGAGFLASTTGKVVAGVVALFVLLAITGVIVAMFGATRWLNSGGVVVASTTTASSVAATVPAGSTPVVEPAEIPLSSSFTFRNVFAPSVKPSEPAAAETTTTSSSSAGSTNTPDTLYLIDIVSTDGVPQGVFVWNGVTYTEGAGGVIDSSPWKVLEVGTDSVLMLYGDTQVTLTVGQGISK
jgi:hypothetical protein